MGGLRCGGAGRKGGDAIQRVPGDDAVGNAEGAQTVEKRRG